jgi:hypothetical protein
MEREFKSSPRGRMVLAALHSLHCFHPECAPAGAVPAFVLTKQTYCAACHEPLYKKVKGGPNGKD